MTTKIGIVQGRLIRSPQGQLQCFPDKHWRSEFFIAECLGLSFVELLVERQHNPNNPVWSDQGVEELRTLARETGRDIYTICDDFIIDHPLVDNPQTMDQCFKTLERGALLGCSKMITPLFEASEINSENKSRFIKPILQLADKGAKCGIEITLETLLDGAELQAFLGQLNHPNVKVCFDTGNRVALKQNIPNDIRLLGSAITHVHLKDKNFKNENVLFGTGEVNFHEVFSSLKDIQYKGAYTFEANKGKNPIATAQYNLALAKFFWGESNDHEG